MDRLCFASDNASGVHPEVLQAIERANQGYAIAYGGDPYTLSVIEKIQSEFDADAEVFFTFGGTGANVIGIGSVARSFEAVFCSDCSHLWADECAAPQKFFGGKLIPVPSAQGKITAAAVRDKFGPDRGVHHARPRVLSVTQPTELGTVYSIDQLRALADFAHERAMVFHVDGARLANAAVALDVPLRAITTGVGVDVLSLGGTKNGLLGAEAVLFFNHGLAEHAGYIRKQTTQLASKMRFIAAQFDALFTDGLWQRSAAHANNMAARLAGHIAEIDAISLTVPQEINALFPRLPSDCVEELQRQCDFYMWDLHHCIARWMTSFATQEEQVDRFAEIIKSTL